MPIITDFNVPSSAEGLDLPTDSNAAFFIAFLASTDPVTGKPWCPDVVAALPHLRAAFSADAGPQAAFVEVGLRPEYRLLSPWNKQINNKVLTTYPGGRIPPMFTGISGM